MPHTEAAGLALQGEFVLQVSGGRGAEALC